MERPEQHEIDTKAQRIFTSSLPASWVTREQHPDYGIDYDVEIFDDGKPTGISFYVQLKGTSSPDYSEQIIRFSFEVDKLLYYFEKVKKPTFLIVVDVQNEKCYWLFTQRYVQEELNKTKPDWYTQQTITLHLPLTNSLPESIQQLQNTAKNGFQFIYVLQLGRPKLKISLEIQNKLNDLKAVENAIKQNELEAGELKIYIAERYLDEGKREESINELLRILNDTRERGSPEVHIFSATKLVYAQHFIEKTTNRELVKTIETALKRQAECKYKSVILIAKATKCFLDIVYSFQQIRNLDIFAEIVKPQNRGTEQLLRIFQTEAFKEYSIAFESMYSIISEAIKENELNAATHIMVQLSEAYLFISPFLISFEERQAQPILEYTSTLIDNALQAAKALKNPELVCYALQTKSNLLFQSDNKDYINVLSEIIKIAKENNLPHYEKAATRLLQMYEETKSLRSIKAKIPKEITIEQEIELLKSLAKLDGLDLDDKDDPIAQIINLGIRDLNPERALKHCQHLYISILSYGLPGEMFGLPTAGSKLLYCNLKGVAIGGMELDNIFSGFKDKYCNNCRKRYPHPESWKWTRQWQMDREKNIPVGLKNTLNAIRNPKPHKPT